MKANIEIKHPIDLSAVASMQRAMTTTADLSRAMMSLSRAMTRPRTCIALDGIGMELSALRWHFPTWRVRRRPFDWRIDV